MPGLYLHVPFCVLKCRYCDFPSYAGVQDRMAAYLRAMTAEMDTLANEEWGAFDTVFLGGGTPSLLTGDELNGLMRALRQRFQIAPDAEISMECNPGTVDAHKLHEYRNGGINRLSLGLQSMDDRLLRRIGRIHTQEQFLAAYTQARKAGFENINVDVMAGLPGQTQSGYLDTLKQVVALSPEHVSAYGLILEEGTPLFDDVEFGRETVPDEDTVSDMLDAGLALLEASGYARYEISNYARPGFRCRHNLNYWRNGEYLGIGAAAHSAWRLRDSDAPRWTRWSNPSDLGAYEASVGLSLAVRELTRIPVAEEAFETVMLGLRTVKGVSLVAFNARFGQALDLLYPHAIQRLLIAGWMEMADGFARLTRRGLDMQNSALQYFLEETE
ncbi:MAG: radical SAM family heme chaperone HemW [Bacillota bacterium]